jgi:16S rRNA (guanine966-N2)-methyltransferase
VRVIAGRWKGRRLKSPRGDEVRPTTDRVKEAIFNLLGPNIRGCLFLDLCCGAGGLGIEALSREAAQVVFVDVSGKSLTLARKNLATCGADTGRVSLIRAEAVAWLSAWIPPPSPPRWIAVADPPYRSPVAGAILGQMARLADDPGFRAGVIEHGIRTPDLDTGAHASLNLATRRYGESRLVVIRPGTPDPDQGERP